MRKIVTIAALSLALPAAAEAIKSDASDFISSHKFTVAASPDKVWDRIAKP